MQGFTNDELKRMAATSQQHLAGMWELFPIPGPVPDVHPSIVWAVMTAALGDGWVERVVEVGAPLTREERDWLRDEGEEKMDYFHAGYLRGERAAYEKLKPETANGQEPRLVTMTATPDPPAVPTTEETTRQVDNKLESLIAAISGDYSEKIPGQAQVEAALNEPEPTAAEGQVLTSSVEFAVTGVDVGVLTDFLVAAAITEQKPALPDALLPGPTLQRVEPAEERQKALWDAVYALQDMALGDVMPTPEMWDKNKPAHMLTAELLCLRLNMDWATLARYAKLTPAAKRGRPTKK